MLKDHVALEAIHRQRRVERSALPWIIGCQLHLQLFKNCRSPFHRQFVRRSNSEALDEKQYQNGISAFRWVLTAQASGRASNYARYHISYRPLRPIEHFR